MYTNTSDNMGKEHSSSETGSPPSPPRPKATATGRYRFKPMAILAFTRSNFALIGLIALVVIASIDSPGFLSLGNASNVLTSNASEGVICVGMALVIISGNFDLSVGGIYALGAVVCAMSTASLGVLPALVLGLLIGAAAGLVNGILVGLLRMNSFIVTLGTGSVFSGLAFVVSKDQSISVSDPAFQTLGTGSWLNIPISIWVLGFVFLVGGIVLHKTTFGYSLYSSGGNAEAARLAGLRVGTVRTAAFVILGALSALGGIIFASELGVGQANVGANTALDVIAIVIIGGASLFGGEGTMLRTLAGFLLIAVLGNLFNLLAVSSSVQLLVKGAVLVVAVSMDAETVSVLTSKVQALRRRGHSPV